MKAIAALFAFALCSTAVPVQGGVIGDVINVPLNLVQSILENLLGILSGLDLPLPNVNLDAGADLNEVRISLGPVHIGALEDDNMLDLEVNNVTLLVENANIHAHIDISNLNLPALGNVSLSDDISINVEELRVSLTVRVKLHLGTPVISDLVNVDVKVKLGVAVALNISSDVLNLALGVNLPLKIQIAIGRQIENNKEAIIAQLNQLAAK